MKEIDDLKKDLDDMILLHGDKHESVARVYSDIAYNHYNKEDYNEALVFYEKALDIANQILGNDSEFVVDLYYRIGKTKENIAVTAESKLGEAQDSFQEAVALREEFDAVRRENREKAVRISKLADSLDSTLIYNDLAEAARQKGDFEEAKVLYLKSLQLRRKKFGDNSPAIPPVLVNYSHLLRQQENFEEAKECLEEALAIYTDAYGSGHASVAEVTNYLGLIFKMLGDLDTAETMLQESLRVRRELFGDLDLSVGATLNNLAELCRERGDYMQAIGYHNQAIRAFEYAGGETHPGLMNAKGNLGITLNRYSAVNAEQGGALLKDTVTFLQHNQYDKTHPWLVKFGNEHILNQAQKLAEQGKHEHSLGLFETVMTKKLAAAMGRTGMSSPAKSAIGTGTLDGGGSMVSTGTGRASTMRGAVAQMPTAAENFVILRGRYTSMLGKAKEAVRRAKWDDAADLIRQCEEVTFEVADLQSSATNQASMALSTMNTDGNLANPSVTLRAQQRLQQQQKDIDELAAWSAGFVVDVNELNAEKSYLTHEFGAATEQYTDVLNSRVDAEGPDTLNVSRALLMLGELARTRAQYVDAENLITQAMETANHAVQRDMNSVGHAHAHDVHLYIRCLLAMAELQRNIGAYEVCTSLLSKAQELCIEYVMHEDAVMAECLCSLAAIEYTKGGSDGSFVAVRKLLQEALDIRTRLYGTSHPKCASIQLRLGMLDLQACNFVDAERRFGEARTTLVMYYGDGLTIETGKVTVNFPIATASSDDDEDASASAADNNNNTNNNNNNNDNNNELALRPFGSPSPSPACCHLSLARAHMEFSRLRLAQDHLGEAAMWAARALDSYRQVLGDDHPATARSKVALAAIRREQGLHTQAMELAGTALDSRKAAYESSMMGGGGGEEENEEEGGATPRPHWAVTESMLCVASIYNFRGYCARALHILTDCVARQETTMKQLGVGYDLGHVTLLDIELERAKALIAQGQVTLAREVAGRCGVWGSAIFSTDDQPAHHLSIAKAMFVLAEISKTIARHRDAKVQYSVCMAMRQKKLGVAMGGATHHSGVIEVLLASANNMRRVGYFHDALEACALAEELCKHRKAQEALAAADNYNMGDSPVPSPSLEGTGEPGADLVYIAATVQHAHTRSERGKGGRAEQEFVNSLETLKASCTNGDRTMMGLDIRLGLAKCYKGQNKIGASEKTYQAAMVLCKELLLNDGVEERKAKERRRLAEQQKAEAKANAVSNVMAAFSGGTNGSSKSSKKAAQQRPISASTPSSSAPKHAPLVMEIMGDMAFLKITQRPQDQTAAMRTMQEVVMPYFMGSNNDSSNSKVPSGSYAAEGDDIVEDSTLEATAGAAKPVADGFGPNHPFSAHIKGRVGLFMNMAKKDSGRKVIFEALNTIDAKGQQFQWTNDHPWVQELGGFEKHAAKERLSISTEEQALTTWSMPLYEGDQSYGLLALPKNMWVDLRNFSAFLWGAVHFYGQDKSTSNAKAGDKSKDPQPKTLLQRARARSPTAASNKRGSQKGGGSSGDGGADSDVLAAEIAARKEAEDTLVMEQHARREMEEQLQAERDLRIEADMRREAEAEERRKMLEEFASKVKMMEEAAARAAKEVEEAKKAASDSAAIAANAEAAAKAKMEARLKMNAEEAAAAKAAEAAAEAEARAAEEARQKSEAEMEAAIAAARAKFEAESGPRKKAIEASEFLLQRATCLAQEGKYFTAQPLFEEVLYVRRDKLAESDGRLGEAILALARNHINLNQWEKAAIFLAECDHFAALVKKDAIRRKEEAEAKAMADAAAAKAAEEAAAAAAEQARVAALKAAEEMLSGTSSEEGKGEEVQKSNEETGGDGEGTNKATDKDASAPAGAEEGEKEKGSSAIDASTANAVDAAPVGPVSHLPTDFVIPNFSDEFMDLGILTPFQLANFEGRALIALADNLAAQGLYKIAAVRYAEAFKKLSDNFDAIARVEAAAEAAEAEQKAAAAAAANPIAAIVGSTAVADGAAGALTPPKPKKAAGPHPLLGVILCLQVTNSLRIGKLLEARAMAERANAILAKAQSHADSPPAVAALAQMAKAQVLSFQGRPKEAFTLLEQAMATRRRLLGDNHPHVSDSLMWTARTLCECGRAPEALIKANLALAQMREFFPDTDLRVAAAQQCVGEVLLLLDDRYQALHLFETALATRERQGVGAELEVADSKYWLGRLLTQLGRFSRAKELLNDSITTRKHMLCKEPSAEELKKKKQKEGLHGEEESDDDDDPNKPRKSGVIGDDSDFDENEPIPIPKKKKAPPKDATKLTLDDLDPTGTGMSSGSDGAARDNVLDPAVRALKEEATLPPHVLVAMCKTAQGELYRQSGDYSAAKQRVDSAIEEVKKIFDGSKEHPLFLDAQFVQCCLLMDRGEEKDIKDCEKLTVKSVRILLIAVGDEHPDFARAQLMLARIDHRRGLLGGSLEKLKVATVAYRMSFGDLSYKHSALLECQLLESAITFAAIDGDITAGCTPPPPPAKKDEEEEDNDKDEDEEKAAAAGTDNEEEDEDGTTGAKKAGNKRPAADGATEKDEEEGEDEEKKKKTSTTEQAGEDAAAPAAEPQYDEDGNEIFGPPVFENEVYRHATGVLREVLTAFRERLEESDAAVHPTVAYLNGFVGISLLHEYSARARYIASLSDERKKEFKDLEMNALRAQGLTKSKIPPGMREVEGAIKTLEAVQNIEQETHIWLVMLRTVLANAVFALDEMEEAAQLFEEAEALRIKGAFLEADRRYDTVFLNQVTYLGPAAASVHLDVAETLLGKATNSLWLGKYALARTLYGQAIAVFRKKLGGDNEGVLRGVLGLAAVLEAERKHDEAYALRMRALDSQLKLVPEEERDTHELPARTKVLIMGDLVEIGKYSDALALGQEAHKVLDLLPENECFADLAKLHTFYARIYLVQGEFDKAQESIDMALSILETAYPDKAHYTIADVLQVRAELLGATGRVQEAHKLIGTVLKRRVKVLGISNAVEYSKNTATTARQSFFEAVDSLSVESSKPAPIDGEDGCENDDKKEKKQGSMRGRGGGGGKRVDRGTPEDQELEEEMNSFKDIEQEFRNGSPGDEEDDEMSSLAANNPLAGTSFFKFGTPDKLPAAMVLRGVNNGVGVAPHTLICATLLVKARLALCLAEPAEAAEMITGALSMMSTLVLGNKSKRVLPVTPFKLTLQFEQAQQMIYAGQYDAARAAHDSVLTARLQMLDEEHIDRSDSLYALATCCTLQSKFDDSTQFLTEALHIRMNALGEKHWKVGEVYYAMADVLFSRSHYADSGELLDKAIALFKKQFGDNDLHPQISQALLVQSANARETGNYDLAYALADQAMNSRILLLGEGHPDCAYCMYVLALVQRGQGRVLAAKKNLDSCIALQRDRLGKYHPHTVSTLLRLAFIFTDLAKYATAGHVFARANQLLRKSLGKDHVLVATGAAGLGDNLRCEGWYDKAKEQHEAALYVRRKVLGERHPDVAESLFFLGELLCIQGKFEDATRNLDDSLAMQRMTLGQSHPVVATTMTALGKVFLATGKLSDAKFTFERSAMMRKQLLPAEHASIADSQFYIASTFRAMGRLDQSAALLERCLSVLREARGPRHPLVGTALHQTGEVALQSGRFSFAKERMNEAFVIRVNCFKEINENHPDLVESYAGLADLLRTRGRYDLVKKYTGNATAGNLPPPAAPKRANQIEDQHSSQPSQPSPRAQIDAIGESLLDGVDETALAAVAAEVAENEAAAAAAAVSEQQQSNGDEPNAESKADGSRPVSAQAVQAVDDNAGDNASVEAATVHMSVVEQLDQPSVAKQGAGGEPLRFKQKEDVEDEEDEEAEGEGAVANVGGPARAMLEEQETYFAKPLYERVMKLYSFIYEDAVNHPAYMSAQYGHAETLRLMGEFKQALEKHEEVLQQRRKILGEGHPDTVLSLLALAEALRSLGLLYPETAAGAVEAKAVKKSKSAKAVGVTSLLDQLESVAAPLEPDAALAPGLAHAAATAATRPNSAGQRPVGGAANQPQIGPKKAHDPNWKFLTKENVTKKPKEALRHTKGYMGYQFPIGKRVERPDAPSLSRPSKLKSDDAKRLIDGGLRWQSKLFGDDAEHPTTAALLFARGELLRGRRDYTTALVYLERALVMRRRIYRGSHPAIAECLFGMAELFRMEGKYAQAAPLYDKATEIRVDAYAETDSRRAEDNESSSSSSSSSESALALHSEHPSVAESKNGQAMLYFAQGRYNESRTLLMEALELCENKLGGSHAATAQSLHNLASVLQAMGLLADALPLYSRALDIKKQVYGESSLEVANILSNMGLLLSAQGGKLTGGSSRMQHMQRSKLEEAQKCLEQALELQRNKYGTLHPDVATSLNNLAAVLVLTGNAFRAKDMYLESIEVRIALFGMESLAVAATYNNYGGLLFSLREMESAQDMFEDALRIRRRILGEDHPDVAASLNNIGLLLYSQGFLKEAVPVYQQALAIKIKCMGENNVAVATSLNNLAGLQHKLGDLDEARANYEKAYILRVTLNGAADKDTKAVKENIKQVERDQQRQREKNAAKRTAAQQQQQQAAAGGAGLRAVRQNKQQQNNNSSSSSTEPTGGFDGPDDLRNQQPILASTQDFRQYERSHFEGQSSPTKEGVGAGSSVEHQML